MTLKIESIEDQVTALQAMQIRHGQKWRNIYDESTVTIDSVYMAFANIYVNYVEDDLIQKMKFKKFIKDYREVI